MQKLFLLFLIPLSSLAQLKSSDRQEILEVMSNQQESWNKADLTSFMEGYWKSDSLKFIGGNGITYGWQTTLANYKKRYPSPEAMGKLTFTILSVEKISNRSVFMIGKYHLKRVTDEPSGYFTLLWHKIDRKWVIVVDHSS